MPLISVCIPTYEMHGKGAEFLRFSFGVLARQTFKDFDVVVSDHSAGDEIRAVCDEWRGRLGIRYVREEDDRGSSAANMNNAIRNADGRIVKMLLQDDFLYHDRALEDIAEAFDPEHDRWLLTPCVHSKDGATFFRALAPSYDDATILFKNTVSSPSVLAFKNEEPVLFDKDLIWYTDTDYYKRCYERFGPPKILASVNVVNRVGPHQVSNHVAEQRKEREFKYVLEKFHVHHMALHLWAYRIGRWKRWAKGLIKRSLRIEQP